MLDSGGDALPSVGSDAVSFDLADMAGTADGATRATSSHSEAFFDSVPDDCKIRLLDGTVLHDTAILPDFLPPALTSAAWAAVCALPDADASIPLTLDFEHPRWVTGQNPALTMRGRALKRDKLWFQRSMEYALDAKLCLTHAMNHFIVTRYATGADNIGQHSDKTLDWTPGSVFAVVKLGEQARPFTFTQAVDGKEVEIYREVLAPGTAVIVGFDANQRVKHGVPPVEGPCGLSGSIVGRAIATRVAWPTVQSNIAASAAERARVKEKQDAERAIAATAATAARAAKKAKKRER